MHRKTRFPLRAATFAVALMAAVPVMQMFGDATPLARGEPAHTATPARDLRGRNAEEQRNMRVIDGDTLEDMATDITYRLVNIDTPDTGSRARCVAERNLGNRATQRARSLVTSAQNLELRPTGRIDRYGRTIAFVLIDGRDLGEAMIAEGLARPWRGRREPWCNADGSLIP